MFRIRIHLIRIRIQHFRLNAYPDPGFWWKKNWKMFTAKKNFFYQKLQFTDLYACIKDAQSTGEVYSFQNTTYSTSKHEISYFISSTFLCHFCPPGSGSGLRIRIRIENTDPDPLTWLNPDPDPKHWLERALLQWTLDPLQCVIHCKIRNRKLWVGFSYKVGGEGRGEKGGRG